MDGSKVLNRFHDARQQVPFSAALSQFRDTVYIEGKKLPPGGGGGGDVDCWRWCTNCTPTTSQQKKMIGQLQTERIHRHLRAKAKAKAASEVAVMAKDILEFLQPMKYVLL
ncbi:hypothetical protein M0802_002590 [Mischocyttarus mexicanus]|nr:hypothetical protein M0802_002590 [Mischocyttarus mexicanus]